LDLLVFLVSILIRSIIWRIYGMIRPFLLISLTSALVACGGGTSGGISPPDDSSAPSGYGVSLLTDPIDADNQTTVSFSLSNAEVGSTYRYTFTDAQNAQVSQNGTIDSGTQNFSEIDLSSLADGDIDLQLTLTDTSNNTGAAAQIAAVKNTQPLITTIQLSGLITFDRIFHNSNGRGLNYASTSAEPAREVTLRVVDAGNQVLLTTRTDVDGLYQVNVEADLPVRVEVLAELSEADPTLNWLVRVVDNGAGDSLYVLRGSFADTGSLDQVRNLHAGSGWNGFQYAEERAAAPFAILDSVYQINSRLRSEALSLSMPDLEIHWSPNNTDGSFYQSAGNSPYIEIAGAADIDTDEYDQHVIVHEWRHYFESMVSRGDTIGGSHSTSSMLEPRTAYSEGTGNAWSGIILDDPIYKDALGDDQDQGFQFSMESSAIVAEGWYIEKSVQEIVYDLVDTEVDGADSISMSVADLVTAWQSSEYLNQTSLTTIYSLRTALGQISPVSVASIDALMQGEDIQGTGYFGEGETNGGGLTYSLPVYHQLLTNGAAIEICSDSQADGEYNRIENRQLVRFSIAIEDSYNILMERDALNTNWDALVEVDPDFSVYRQGEEVATGASAPAASESWTGNLVVGDYVIDAYDWFNVDDDSGTGGLTCFDISVLAN
jgi:hypothetical protein